MSRTSNSRATGITEAGREAWGAFFQLAMSNRAHLLAALAELDLTFVQAHALRVLDPDRPMPMSDLAGVLVCDASNVTGIVDRLEARGLVERRPGVHDRRVKTLVVTPEGRELRAQVLEKHREPPPGIARLTPEEQETLRELAQRAAGRA